jgi:alpha 1,3-glucosidase
MDPYRLFNTDVFKYPLNSTSSLYGSIPFLLGHYPNESTNIGIYWLNTAETWVDLYTPK